jgi:hypothetical protein
MDNLIQRLTFNWKLAKDSTNTGIAEGWFKQVHPTSKDAPVPGIVQQVFPETFGVFWYYCTFKPELSVKDGGRVLVHLGAVDYLAEVWLNSKKVGGHEGGETPFDIDVTDAFLLGTDNLLAIRVLNTTEDPIDGYVLNETPHRNKFIKGYTPGCGYNYGGVVLPVELRAVPAIRISDLYTNCRMNGDIDIQVTVHNVTGATVSGTLALEAGPAMDGIAQTSSAQEVSFPAGDSVHKVRLHIAKPRLWDVEDPYLYAVNAGITVPAKGISDTRRVRCGFREFRVAEDGYFNLNGRRIFLRSTHTGNHFPIGQCVPLDPSFMFRDLLYAKTCGFNTVRFISGMAWPEQLDYCDEIGLMVYEESLAGWMLLDSPHMKERYDFSIREMVLRDRNHPSLTIWGMLNETPDGPVFRHAVKSLDLVRSLDDNRLVLLASGRWDGQWNIGSVSNPGSSEWKHVWGPEAPGAAPCTEKMDWNPGGYMKGAGDAHMYPHMPQTDATKHFLRTVGHDTRPVFLSEYGCGSQFNLIDEYRHFQQFGARDDLFDMVLIRSQIDRMKADLKWMKLDNVYPLLEDFFRDSYRLNMRQRRNGFDLVRSNPKFCGWNITGMLDHAFTGEGLWSFWREWKPGIADVLKDGFSPLRWCLFANPGHAYSGQKIRLEAVLANEDILKPGKYKVRFSITGKQGIVWDKSLSFSVPQKKGGREAPLAIPVLNTSVKLNVPAGGYTFAASLEGGAPLGDRLPVIITDPKSLPKLKGKVTVWGLEAKAVKWLEKNGLDCKEFNSAKRSKRRELILVDTPQKATVEDWRELARRMAQGGTVIFLNQEAFRMGDNPVARIPLKKKGRMDSFNDWLYHKECIAGRHEVFDGLQGPGIMDWEYYDQVIAHGLYTPDEKPAEVMSAAFSVGYTVKGGYVRGIQLCSYGFEAGEFILSTFNILQNIGHPAADHFLANLVKYGMRNISKSAKALPTGLEAKLKALGYT